MSQSQDAYEVTPSGPGVKFDANKPRVELFPYRAVLAGSRAMTYGAAKYSAHNWKGGMRFGRLAAALLRHVFAWLGGEDFDAESGLHHLDHAQACLAMLIDTVETRPDLDDRYKPEAT